MSSALGAKQTSDEQLKTSKADIELLIHSIANPPLSSYHLAMPIPQTKSELLNAIEHNFARLIKEYESIPTELTKTKSLDGHKKDTLMSIHDLVAYQVGWHEIVLNWHERERTGHPIEFPAPGFKWNELGDLAQKFYADYSDKSYVDLLSRLKRTKNEIMHIVSSFSNEELYGVKWYKNYTRGRMVQFNTASPYNNAYTRMRKWNKTQKS